MSNKNKNKNKNKKRHKKKNNKNPSNNCNNYFDNPHYILGAGVGCTHTEEDEYLFVLEELNNSY